MTLAYAIRFDGPMDASLASFRSEAFAREVADLDWTARETYVRPLSAFCGPHMFPPADVLKSVQILHREIAAWPAGVKSYTGEVLRDLLAFERVLRVAQQQGRAFRFEVVDDDNQPA
jgi:hypothetical protein